MNIRDLEYLVSVAKHGHFGQAAEACYVSQPALSMQIKKLEAELGVTLLERHNKQVMLTNIGHEVVARSQRILEQVNDIEELARGHQAPLAGPLRLGLFPTLAPYYLPLIIPTLKNALPDIQWQLIEEKSPVLIESLQRGELDMICIAQPLDEYPGLTSQPLFKDKFYLAVPEEHKLAKRKWASLDMLKDETLLLLDEGHCLRDQALEVCSMVGQQEQKGYGATSLETLRNMVRAGRGITLIPDIAIGNEDGLSYLPFKQNGLSRTISLACRNSFPRRTLYDTMVKLLSHG